MSDIDQDKIKKAINDFESSEYTDSEDEIKGQIRKKVRSHVQNKLDLNHELDNDFEEE